MGDAGSQAILTVSPFLTLPVMCDSRGSAMMGGSARHESRGLGGSFAKMAYLSGGERAFGGGGST